MTDQIIPDPQTSKEAFKIADELRAISVRAEVRNDSLVRDAAKQAYESAVSVAKKLQDVGK